MNPRADKLAVADWKDLHIQLLDDTWLLTIFAVLLALALPWFLSGFDIDIGSAFWGAIALGGIHLALTAEGWLKRLTTAWRGRALALLHAIGVIVLGWIWHNAGGLQNPVFLVAFALPVIGANYISRWQPYLTAVLATLVVAAVALIQNSELRWYLASLSPTGASLAALFAGATDAGAPFRGFYAPYGYSIVMIEAFAVLLLACAVAAEYLGTVFERLYANVESARAEAEQGQELWTTMIERLPIPALLVDTDTLRVVCASEHLVPRFRKTGAPAAGLGLFEAIDFSYPEVVQELITHQGGIARAGMVRVGDQLRAVSVRVQHLQHRGHRLGLVILEEITELFCAQAALDAAEYAALVVDSRGRIITFNKLARELFAGTEFGTALKLLTGSGADAPWWTPGLTGRRKMHVQVAGRICQVTSSIVPLPGEEESFHVIAFHPTARVTAPVAGRSAEAEAPIKETLLEQS